jgi:uncharacterized membrane protein
MTELERQFSRAASRISNRPGSIPRWGALLGGGTLAIVGLTRRSKSGVAMAAAGGLLAYAGTRKNGAARSDTAAHSSVVLNTTPEEAYRFWRDFENMPRYMPHIESVSKIGERTYRFIARLPMARQVRWDAEIVGDRQNESIAWRSLPGSDLQVNGSVDFRRASGDRGTLVSTRIEYTPVQGGIASAARFLHKSANFFLRQNLRRAKALIETGEIPTIEGQSHGPRSTVTGVLRAMDPSKPPRGEHSFREVMEARRSVS